MTSLALDDLFARKLVAALGPLGDNVETMEQAGKRTTRITARGQPLVEIQRAPVKSMARMYNK